MTRIATALIATVLSASSTGALAFGLAGIMNQPDPSWGFINNRQFVNGYVYTRGIYKNENGYPVYVVYDDSGKEISEIGSLDPNGPYANSRIMAASEYQSYIDQYEADLAQFRETYPNTPDPELLTVEQYEDRISNLTTSVEPAEPWKGTESDKSLLAGTISVLARPESLLYTPESPYLMRQYPIDMTDAQTIFGGSGSLILSEDGKVLYTSEHRIALRAVFYEDINTGEFDPGVFVSSAKKYSGVNPKLTNPIQGIPLTSGMGSQGAGTTNDIGQYSMMIMATPCPTFFYQYNESIEGWIPYRSFNPDITGAYLYPIIRTFNFVCNGMATYSFQPGINPPLSLDFPIDVNILTGSIRMPSVQLGSDGDTPSYDLEIPESFTRTKADFYDFDLDGESDTTYCGEQNDEGDFVVNPDCQTATVQGVYLSSAENDPEAEGCSEDPSASICQPNFMRIMDFEREDKDKALVSQLSPEHMKDTDLFVIRQSNGQLIAQRQGLKDDEEAYEPAGGDGLSDNDINLVQGELRVDYGMVLRGMENLSNQYYSFRAWDDERGFSTWQAKGNMAPELYAHRESDQVRAGETLEVWAINRVTGYIGHADVVVGEDQLQDSFLDTNVSDIELRPPNLKIWAERRYNIEAGMTQGEHRDYLISHEGAGEGDDTYIQLFVEWLDHDGNALPDALKDYGYTGRLAYVSGENSLSDASQAGHARFDIKPGKHVELLRLPGAGLDNLHYYVQVNGIPYNSYDDFSLGLQNRVGDVSFEGTPENNYRPESYVPIKVPLYDEEVTDIQYQAYMKERERLAKEEDFDALEKLPRPIPAYDWVYRPEYQYSVYDLVVDELHRETQNDTDESTIDIYQDSTPTLSSMDDAVSILYELGYSESSPLPSMDGEKQLVFNLGESELDVTLSGNGTLAFDDLSSLSLVEPEDFLTASLYLNSDAGNLLWQYAFEYLIVEPLASGIVVEPHETLYVSADDPVFDWKARLMGYASRKPDVKEPINLRWLVSGEGAMDETVQFNDSNGLFLNRIVMPTTAGSKANLEIDMVGTDMEPIELPTIEVVPGEPHSISYSTTGSLATEAPLTQDFIVTVRDRNGNLVQDGTPVDVFTHNSLELADHDLETSGGKMQFSLQGGPFKGDASVTIKSVDASIEVPVQVRPLNIDLDYPQALGVGQSGQIKVTVTDHEGNAVPNADVVLKSTFAYVGSNVIVTDDQGVATTTITAPQGVRDGELTAMVGMSSYTKTHYSVLDPNSELGNLQADALALVGDQSETGSVSYARYDGSIAEIPYRIEGTVKVKGSQDESVEIELGDVYAPNRALSAAYMMNDLEQGQINNDAGQDALLVQGVKRVNDAMIGQGHSMQWTYNPDVPALMYGDNIPAFTDPTGMAWTAELKLDDIRSRNQRLNQEDSTHPDAGDSPAEIINLGQGGQTLTITDEGTLQLKVRTNAATVELTSDPIQITEWHRIAVTTHSNRLTLWVDDNRYETSLPEFIDYQWTQYDDPLLSRDAALPHDLVVGKGLIGRINGLKFYDHTSQPLIILNGSGEVATVTIDESGEQPILLKSQGLMRPEGSELATQRIAIRSGGSRQYVSLISTSVFTEMAGFYATHLAENAPPIDLAFNGEAPTEEQLSELLRISELSAFDPFGQAPYPWAKTAHAGFGLDFLWDTINFFIPIESIGIVFEQLALLATDPEEFDAMEFTIAAVDVLTIFPPAKPLKAVTKPMQVMMRGIARTNPKFSKHFAGVLGKVMNRAKKGDFDTLWNLLPFLVVVIDLYQDEESRQGLEMIWSSVSSPDDLMAWIDWLGLPGEEWAGEEVPDVEAFASVDDGFVIPGFDKTAYAASGSLARVSSSVIGNTLEQAGKRLDGGDIKNLPKRLSDTVTHIKHVEAQKLRRFVHSPDMIRSVTALGLKGGSRSVRNFLRGKTNARISPAATLAITAYLGWEMSCGKILDAKEDFEADGDEDEYTPPDLGQEEGEVLDYSQMLTTLECGDKGLRGAQNRFHIYRMFGSAFTDAANRYYEEEDIVKEDSKVASNNFLGSGHGALFHLSQVARFQALARAGGLDIKSIEGQRKVWLYVDEDAVDDGDDIVDRGDPEFGSVFYDAYERYVDIVLGDEDSERWVELKSYSCYGNSGKERYWPASFKSQKSSQWDLVKGQTEWPSLHRQFLLDRTASKVGHARLNGTNSIELVSVASEFEWLFQKFKVNKKNTKGKKQDVRNVLLGSVGTADSIRDALSKKPKAARSARERNYDIYMANMDGYISMTDKVRYADLNGLLSDMVALGFDSAVEAIKELPDLD
ncbi:hypothetical protein [Saccharospirillum salsuginis]|uniref:Big-1 domain-containing protein n=1 Tax=Saccharospirillum salsuginis TaxID=418750 RepID=A0A918K9Y1_9GAMM|nr:hypothetical protein [Saccharospirillum salsuginis]GGX56066.1 hypothetical protein GCM10007392_24820 [Saccharospirillum salsuginis]